MTRSGQQSQQRQVYIAQFICRQCHFTSVDAEGIRHHVNSHMLEAAISFHTPRPMPTQQLRERNLLFNPFRQLLPPPTRSNTGPSVSNCLQMQRSPQGSAAWRRPRSQTQVVQAAQQIARQGTEGTTEDHTMPLIDQLDQPIPQIIDLDSDQNEDYKKFDLTLRL